MKFTLHIIVLLFLSSCANIVAPTGGKKDSESPKLLSSTSEINKNSLQKDVPEFFRQTQKVYLFQKNWY